MAATNAAQFENLLTRIGINQGTSDAITMNQGIVDMQTLVTIISEDQVKRMPKLLSYGPPPILPRAPVEPPPLAPNLVGDAVAEAAHDDLVEDYERDRAVWRNEVRDARVHMSAVSATKFHAIWYWGVLRNRCGRELSASNRVLTAGEINRTLVRIKFEEHAKDAAEEGTPKKPHVLKKIEKFNEWLDAFNSYMSSIRGAARIPLPYVYRTKADVTDEMRNETYATTDEEYMALFELEGSYFDVDNERVFNELMQYVLTGPGESVVKPYRTKRNGRGAMVALQAYANGTDAIELRASNAYAVLASTVYKRQSRNFTLDDFFARLRDAYSILEHEDVSQPVQELRKWTETMDKIQDPQLHAAKLAIKTSNAKDAEKTFETLCSKIKELAHDIYKSNPQDRRTISSANQGTKQIKDSDLHGGNWSKPDWMALTDEQKDKVRELRKQSKKRKSQARKIKAAKAAKVDEASTDSDGGGDEKKTETAGNQFGRKAHSAKKSNKE